MLKLCKQHKKFIEVFEGSNIRFAEKKGFKELDVEIGVDGQYYLTGQLPKENQKRIIQKTISKIEKEIEEINITQLRDIAIINTNNEPIKIAEARKYLTEKQEKKQELIEKIKNLRG